jgi:regulator of nucleoside diphosphate kinase
MTMIAQNVLPTNEIVITAADFDRLRGLMDSPRYRSTQAPLLMALREELDRGRVVPAQAVPTDVVTMHSQVRVRDLKTQESETYTLVYPEQADINENKLSVLAPLGMALLGTHVRQIVKFDAPAGPRRLRIERILYQPEACGDFHL